MKPPNDKPLSLLKFLLIFLAFIVMSILFGCSASKDVSKKYAVTKIEHLKGNAYLLTTDSFKVVRHVRGAGKYHRDSVSKIGIQ